METLLPRLRSIRRAFAPIVKPVEIGFGGGEHHRVKRHSIVSISIGANLSSMALPAPGFHRRNGAWQYSHS
jgi:hypothetical protein